MSRSLALRQEIHHFFTRRISGSSANKIECKRVMLSIVNNLLAISSIPASWKNLSALDIEKLVNLWREQDLCASSISKKLSVIRKFNKDFNLGINVPCNRKLEVRRAGNKPRELKTNPYVLLENIYNPLSKRLLSLQLEFGLTKIESAKMNLFTSFHDGFLSVSRNIAFNRKDRMIPVTTERQQNIIEKINPELEISQQEDKNFTEKALRVFQSEIFCLNQDYNYPFRNTYAKNRYQRLIKDNTETFSTKTVLKEMGLSSKNYLPELQE